jgi:hypothetical protein
VRTTSLGLHVTLAELKLEAFLPVDPVTAEALATAVHPSSQDLSS